jgi:mercuric reductase
MRKAAKYDVLILGSGSTAVAAAEAARNLDKKVLMAEERLLGGTCLNYGCVPSKFLIEAAKAYFTMKRPRFYGLQCIQSKLVFEDLIQQKDDIVREYREKKRDTVFDDDQISLVRGHADFIDEHTIEVNGKRFVGEKILIATGSRPLIPDINGLSKAGFLTSDFLTCGEPQELTTLPDSLVVVGGGYIAIELGQMFARFGTKVTMLERSAHLLGTGYEPEVGDIIQRVLEDEGVEILFKATIDTVSRSMKNGYHLKVKIGRKFVEMTTAQLLIAAGRQPNSDNIQAERAGVKIAKEGYVKVDRHFRTSTENIYAAGDVIGPDHGNQMATPVGVKDARLAIQNAFSEVGGQSADRRVIPRTIFSEPEVAAVGLTAEQARKKGYTIETRSIALSSVPRAVLMQHTDGVIKIVSDKESDEVIGVTVVAPSAGEVVQQAAMGMRMNARLSDFVDLMYVYPSISEGLRLAARKDADEE